MATSSASFQAEFQILADGLDTAWMLLCATLVVLMQLDFARFEAGSVRSMNIVCTYAKNMLDFVLGIIVACLWGFSLATGSSALSGGGDSISEKREHATAFFFHVALQSASATIVSGAMAERTTVSAYGFLSILVSGLNYSLASRWVWGGGWLSSLSPPVHDHAGSGVVHVIGGFSALAGAAAVGPRLGRWDASKARSFLPQDVPSLISGAFLLWVGWFGLNCGSSFSVSSPGTVFTAANAAMTTTLSAAAGASVAGLYSAVNLREGVLDIVAMANGVIAGLVSITAGADCIDAGLSLLVGAVGGLFFSSMIWVTQHIIMVDDVVGAFAMHGMCGAWGLVAVGLFHRTDGLFMGGGGNLLGSQLLGMVVLAALGFIPTFGVAHLLHRAERLRASTEDERRGLDKVWLSPHRVRSEALSRCATAASALKSCGYDPAQMLDALKALKGIIHRPFTPQAGDHKLEGEVADILHHCVGHAADEAWGGDNSNPESRKDFFGFLSHHKLDAGDAARIFVDNARRIVQERPDQRKYGKIENLMFLDTNNLKELNNLLTYVRASKNYLLLLSRDTLNRPWVLAELCAAHQDGCSLHSVLVEFPGREKNSKMFRFPQDLDAAISEWTDYYLHIQKYQKRGPSMLFRWFGASKILPNGLDGVRLSQCTQTAATAKLPENASIKESEADRTATTATSEVTTTTEATAMTEVTSTTEFTAATEVTSLTDEPDAASTKTVVTAVEAATTTTTDTALRT